MLLEMKGICFRLVCTYEFSDMLGRDVVTLCRGDDLVR